MYEFSRPTSNLQKVKNVFLQRFHKAEFSRGEEDRRQSRSLELVGIARGKSEGCFVCRRPIFTHSLAAYKPRLPGLPLAST